MESGAGSVLPGSNTDRSSLVPAYEGSFDHPWCAEVCDRQALALMFLCLDGHGDPNTSPAYAAAVQALYSVSYAAKFAVKKAGGPDFKVSPLEGLWWAEEMSTFRAGDKSDWDWTMMIRQPDAVTGDLFAHVVDEVAAKKSKPAAKELRLGRSGRRGPSVAGAECGRRAPRCTPER